MRLAGRKDSALREIQLRTDVSPYAEGSCEITCGNTRVLTTASVSESLPKWLDGESQGWITAEYGMLPRSTHTRCRREASSGKQGGRTVEIQRLIGRSLRQAVDLKDIKGLSIQIDCDVITADGGTRTAAITGAWVSLYQALHWAKAEGKIASMPDIRVVSAISAGASGDRYLLDLCYEEDSSIDFDLNTVFLDAEQLVEIQGTGEKRSLGLPELNSLISLCQEGCRVIKEKQIQAISSL